ncbi:alkaline phosphatase family protein [Flaviramulus aquimarinus]|uniref:Alkaline phosphatase family protein n=1 Tax=Flaviramulus aquimarinus TaxID=1170456 RepID=A0ABP9F453_9FLAO
MIKNILIIVLVVISAFSCKAQDNSYELKQANNNIAKPKLIVGIVIDQMRYDYLTRFYSKYGEGGFKRMVNEGYNCRNTHFNYIPTKTGPGHASIFTGTTPKYHGIIGNDWFDKGIKRKVNCVEDNTVAPIGTDSKDGKKSPHRLLTTTFADENRLFTQMKGKTIGISLKHRGAILPAGHTANGAYWLDYEHGGNGNWISSSFYMNNLPKWVKSFNNSDIAESYFKPWNTLYNIDSYTESGPDLNAFEGGFKGKDTPTFPYDLEVLKDENDNYNIIAESPYGNSLITDFALAAIEGEQLGMDDFTDVLTLSFSSTDKVGHNFGVNAIETQDTYLRLDLDLKRIFDALDEKVGHGEYTVFLTADHGAPYTPGYLQSKKIPAGFFDLSVMKTELNEFLFKKYGVLNLVLSRINNQIFLDHDKVNKNQIDLKMIKEAIALQLLQYKLIDKVYVTSEINQFVNPSGSGYLEILLANGHNQKRSGDILFVFNPSVFKDTPWNRTGTDHHSGLSYDTHVPLLFFGKGIKHGQTYNKTDITDIAPTMSALLGISFPNGAIGEPLEFVFKE